MAGLSPPLNLKTVSRGGVKGKGIASNRDPSRGLFILNYIHARPVEVLHEDRIQLIIY